MCDRYLTPSVRKIGWNIYNTANGGITSNYGQPDWPVLMREKAKGMLKAVQQNMGEIILWADSDAVIVQHFDPNILLDQFDIAAQDDGGQYCAGLMVIRCTAQALELFTAVVQSEAFYQLGAHPGSDQAAFNQLVSSYLDITKIDTRLFWTPGIRNISGGWQLLNSIDDLRSEQIPLDVLIVHANWCIGANLKAQVLDLAVKRLKLNLS